ncbi:MAG: hypothetical protein ACTHJ8_00410 [Mucilaginibacter sp.]
MNNELYRKLANLPKIQTKQWFCFWSDILGFGDVFFDNDWKLTQEQKVSIYERLQSAHSIFIQNTLPNEHGLILNDGLVKIQECTSSNSVPGFFFRSCIYTHLGIKIEAEERGLPGPRSILSFGESILYFPQNFHLDDYVFFDTKPDPSKLSSIAQQTGNPIVVYNPAPFQMNTAFSKSYLLDSIGSKQGISGSFIYVDQSIIDFTIESSKVEGRHLLFEENENFTKIAVIPDQAYGRENLPYWGFKLGPKLEISYKNWKTFVYRLLAYYPPDEDHTNFEIETI